MKAREKKLSWLWQRVDLNPGPCDPHSNALTTRLCRSQENAELQDAFLYHYYGWLSNNGLWGCQWPRRSLLTSNLNSVTSTTPIATAFQASTATNSRILYGRISSVDLRTCTSWQVKTLPQEYVLSTCSKLDATSTGMFVVLMMQRQDKSKEMSAGDVMDFRMIRERKSAR